MLPPVFTHPLNAVIFAAACVIWLAPELIGMFRQMAKVSRKDSRVQERGSLALLLGLQYAGIGLNFWLAWRLPIAAMRWQPNAFFWLGVILIPLGTAWRWYAIWTLGRYFTRDVAVATDQPVVQRGPYRLIRHPAYSGTFLTMLGVGLAMTNWASLVALLACVFLGHVYRVRIEEKALIRVIGQPYLDYMRRTRRFIPLVY